MFTLKIAGQSFGVRFQYRGVALDKGVCGSNRFVEVERDTPHDSIRTVCQILKLNDEDRTSELFCEGSVTCTLADNFSKVEGRQRSLTKALANGAQGYHPNRNVRRAVWTAYWANHKDLRPKQKA